MKLWNYVNCKMSRQRSVWVDPPAREDGLRRVLNRGGVVVRGEDGFPQEDLVALQGRPEHRAAGHAGGGGGRLVPEGQTLQGKIGKLNKIVEFVPIQMSWIVLYRKLCSVPNRLECRLNLKCTVLSVGVQQVGIQHPLLLGALFAHRTLHCALAPENVGL